MTGKEALMYLDDIAHERKMELDAHELKEIVAKDLEVLEILKTKQVDIHHLASLCNCCGYENGLNTYNVIPAHKEITLKELETIMEWLGNEG